MESRPCNMRICLCAALTVWVGLVASGFAAVWIYGHRPGPASSPVTVWPNDAPFEPTRDRRCLVMFVHPKCPCTRASIAELERLLVDQRVLTDVRVVVYRPGTEPPAWAQTPLRARIEKIPGVQVVDDPDGRVARLFGATTSGAIMFFEPDGRLAFWGGITPSRGHEGNSVGRVNLARLLHGQPVTERESPVFGCSLFECDGAASS